MFIDTNDNVTAHLALLQAKGVEAVGRYYSASTWKRLTRNEALAVSKAGLKLFVVFENDGDPPLTHETGVHHGQIAVQQAKTVGQPTGSAIYFALEHLPSGYGPEHLPGIEEYLKGVEAVLKDPHQPDNYKIGIYSDGVVCKAMLESARCDYAWISASLSFPGTRDFLASGKWALAQDPKVDQDWGGLSVDTNRAQGDFGAFAVTTALDPGQPAPDPAAFAASIAAPAAGDSATPWMDWMTARIGQVQLTGAVPTPFTEEIFAHTDFGPLKGHTPESCAATVCAALEESGYRSTHSALAYSYHDYGEPCELKPGCICVYTWSDGNHHVNFCAQIVDAETIIGLGGNQSHKLDDRRFLRTFIRATRWPVKAA